MKILEDETWCPESNADCINISNIERKNANYAKTTDDEDPIWHENCRAEGKLFEAQLCLYLSKIGFELKSAVSVGRKYADNGTDLIVENKTGKKFNLQLKRMCGIDPKYWTIMGNVYSTPEQKVQKLSTFNGPILISRTFKQKSQIAIVNPIHIKKLLLKSKFSGYFVPFDDLSIIEDFSYTNLNYIFSKCTN